LHLAKKLKKRMKNTVLVLTLSLGFWNLSAQNRFEPIFDAPQIITLNSITSDINLASGVAKAAIPVLVPEGATGWYFTLEIMPKNQSSDTLATLLEKLLALDAQQLGTSDAVSHLCVPRTGREANIYLIQGSENAESFVNFRGTRYFKRYIQTKSRAAYLPHAGAQNLFIGIENPYNLKGLKIKLEAVAVFE
jgi:hypothetical protein